MLCCVHSRRWHAASLSSPPPSSNRTAMPYRQIFSEMAGGLVYVPKYISRARGAENEISKQAGGPAYLAKSGNRPAVGKSYTNCVRNKKCISIQPCF